MVRNTRFAKQLAIVAAVGMVVTGCGSSGDVGAGEASPLVVAEQIAPVTLDPIDSGLNATWRSWQFTYETLTLVNANGELEPMLAESWDQSEDGLTYTFQLRDGVTFDNGEPLTADDVVFSFERLFAEGAPYGQARFAAVDAINAIGDLEVEFTLSEPNAGFPYDLGNPFVVAAAIVNKKAVEEGNPDAEMVGTGPYRMVSYTPNVELVFERRDDYWGEPAASEDLVIKYMPDFSSQVSALRAGQIDLMFADTTSHASLENAAGIEMQPIQTGRITHLHLNSAVAPLDDIRVRQAIALAIDRDELVEAAFHGLGAPSAHLPSSIPWATPVEDLPNHQQDINKAKRLLAEAGFPNGLELTLMHLQGRYDFLDRSSLVLQEQLAAAGIKISIDPQESTTWLERMNAGDYQLTDDVYGYEGNPYYYFHPRPGRQGPNPPATDAALAAIKNATAEDLQQAYLDAQEALAADVFPDLGLVSIREFAAYRENVTGVDVKYSMDRRFLLDVVKG